MKTKEFIKKVEKLGFEYEKAAEVYFIYDKEGTEYASVCHTTSKQISNMERALDCIDKDVQEKLFDLLIEYAKTPVEDRDEEKKFYLRHRWLDGENEANYLNFEISGCYYSLNSKLEASWAKTKFTLEQIEDIKKNLDTDLNDFELVEVVDE